MASISNVLKQKLEHLLGMSGGYVLDFSNSSFADLVRSSIGVHPYEGRDGSMASVLRQLWTDLSDAVFAVLVLAPPPVHRPRPGR